VSTFFVPGGAQGAALAGAGLPSTFPGSPKLLRGGLVQLDTASKAVVEVIVFQYNPDTVTRTLQPRTMIAEPGDRLETLRLTGPPHETIKLEAEFDAADQLEQAGVGNSPVVRHGLLPVLASLEGLITPTAAQLEATDALFAQGMIEIAPLEAPLIVLVWGVKRVVPVVVANLSITEEAFDPHLHPIRAKASLELKVLSTNDLPVGHLGSTLYLGYRRGVEELARLVHGSDVAPLGLERLA
jgi:hypothetical protein